MNIIFNFFNLLQCFGYGYTSCIISFDITPLHPLFGSTIPVK